MSQLNMTKAAKAAGISRNTLYKKVKKGVISVTQDRDGNRVIDTGELLRVFGELKEVTGGDVHGIRNHQQQVTFKGDTVNSGGDANGLGVVDVLQSQVKDLQSMVERMQGEIDQSREREGRLLSLLETRLLTNQKAPESKRDKKSKKKGKKNK